MRTILNNILEPKILILMSISSLTVGTLILAGCGEAGRSKPVVVGTTTQVADLVREVAGDRLRVVSIISPNVDAHEFEPRARDVEAIAEAKVVFTSGAGVDSWAGKLIEGSGGSARRVELFEPLPVKLKSSGAGPEDRYDPHWWGNPDDVIAAVNRIEKVLSEEFPSNAGTFEKNSARFGHRVDRLDRRISLCFRKIPKTKRKFIANHSSFTYFSDHYGLETAGSLIPSTSTEAQPSAGEIRRIVNKIKREAIPAIFTEASVSPKLAKAVAEDAGTKVEGPLYVDSLGPSGSGADTWIAATRHNARVILIGLGGRKAGACLPAGYLDRS